MEQLTPDLLDKIAQRAHALFGAFMVMAPYLLFGRRAALYSACATALWAAWKEFYWDERNESTEVRGSGVKDFVYYALGVFFGAVVCEIHGIFFHGI